MVRCAIPSSATLPEERGNRRQLVNDSGIVHGRYSGTQGDVGRGSCSLVDMGLEWGRESYFLGAQS